MSKIALSLYKDSGKLEDAQLRSVLLFGQFGTKANNEDYMLQRLVFSVMVEAGAERSISEIQQLLTSEGFASDLKNKDVKKIFDQLESDGLIKQQPSGKYLPISERSEGDDFFKQLNHETDILIDGIYERFLKLEGYSKPTNPQVIKNRIREALSVYMKLCGLTFFELQKDDTHPKDALQELIGTNPDNTSIHLITAIGETLTNHNKQEETVLNKWARAYVVTQILQLDPTLKQFKQDQLRNKSFVLDTDVVLRSLATHANFSKDYRYVLDYLNRLGCKIYVPSDNLTEAEGCAKEALSIAAEMGEKQLREYDEMLLHGSKSNVFIEDYVQQVRNEPDCKNLDFGVYMGNIYHSKSPQVMKKRLADVIGVENVKRELKILPLDHDIEEKLNAVILEKTSSSPKGQERRDSFNAKLARSDTKLYLTLVKCNQQGNPDDEGLLPYKYYLLTQSSRTILAAKEIGIYSEDIICKPQALTAVLNELGEIADSEVSFINLFENPFLVYAADQIWERIKPLIDNGALIYHADIQQLKANVEMRFDGLLTGDGNGFSYEKLKEISKEGLLFPSEIIRLRDEVNRLREENAAKDKVIEQREKEIEKKINEIGRLRYLNRIKHGADYVKGSVKGLLRKFRK